MLHLIRQKGKKIKSPPTRHEKSRVLISSASARGVEDTDNKHGTGSSGPAQQPAANPPRLRWVSATLRWVCTGLASSSPPSVIGAFRKTSRKRRRSARLSSAAQDKSTSTRRHRDCVQLGNWQQDRRQNLSRRPLEVQNPKLAKFPSQAKSPKKC